MSVENDTYRSKTVEERLDEIEKKVMSSARHPAPKSIEERLAEIEGQMASSWALKARRDYEKEIRVRLKTELLNFSTRVMVGAAVLLAGAGYLFLKSATEDIYQNQNRRIIADLKEKFDDNIRTETRQFEWKRQHDYGKNYMYLAEFYWLSSLPGRDAKIDKAFEKAEEYFEMALRENPEQATSYWEIGQLHYKLAKEYGQKSWFDLEKALYNYMQAKRYYSDDEVNKGWRADAYKMIGMVYVEKQKPAEAQTYLQKAKDEYVRAIAFVNRKEINDGIKECDDLLLGLQKGASMVAPAVNPH